MPIIIIRYNELKQATTIAEHPTQAEAYTHALQLAEDQPGTTFMVRGENGELLTAVKRGTPNE